jgi:hypothetical protein
LGNDTVDVLRFEESRSVLKNVKLMIYQIWIGGEKIGERLNCVFFLPSPNGISLKSVDENYSVFSN